MPNKDLIDRVVRAMFECPQPFSSEQLVDKLNEKSILVKDAPLLLEILMDDKVLEQVAPDAYRVTLLHAIQNYFAKGADFRE